MTAIIKTCCCCLTVRKGSRIIAIIYIIGTLCTTALGIWESSKVINISNSLLIKDEVGFIKIMKRIFRGPRTLDYVIPYGALVLSNINTFLSILLLYGVSKDSPTTCSLWLGYNIGLTYVIALFLIYLSLFLMAIGDLIVGLIILICTIFCSLIIRYLLYVVRDYVYDLTHADFLNEPEKPKKFSTTASSEFV